MRCSRRWFAERGAWPLRPVPPRFLDAADDLLLLLLLLSSSSSPSSSPPFNWPKPSSPSSPNCSGPSSCSSLSASDPRPFYEPVALAEAAGLSPSFPVSPAPLAACSPSRPEGLLVSGGVLRDSARNEGVNACSADPRRSTESSCSFGGGDSRGGVLWDSALDCGVDTFPVDPRRSDGPSDSAGPPSGCPLLPHFLRYSSFLAI